MGGPADRAEGRQDSDVEALKEKWAVRQTELKAAQDSDVEALKEKWAVRQTELKAAEDSDVEALKEKWAVRQTELKAAEDSDVEALKEKWAVRQTELKAAEDSDVEALKEKWAVRQTELKAAEDSDVEALKEKWAVRQTELKAAEDSDVEALKEKWAVRQTELKAAEDSDVEALKEKWAVRQTELKNNEDEDLKELKLKWGEQKTAMETAKDEEKKALKIKLGEQLKEYTDHFGLVKAEIDALPTAKTFTYTIQTVYTTMGVPGGPGAAAAAAAAAGGDGGNDNVIPTEAVAGSTYSSQDLADAVDALGGDSSQAYIGRQYGKRSGAGKQRKHRTGRRWYHYASFWRHVGADWRRRRSGSGDAAVLPELADVGPGQYAADYIEHQRRPGEARRLHQRRGAGREHPGPAGGVLPMIHLATMEGGLVCLTVSLEPEGASNMVLHVTRNFSDVDCPACIALAEAPAELAAQNAEAKLVHLAAPECLIVVAPWTTASINPDAPMQALCGAGHREEGGVVRLRITVAENDVTCVDCLERMAAVARAVVAEEDTDDGAVVIAFPDVDVGPGVGEWNHVWPCPGAAVDAIVDAATVDERLVDAVDTMGEAVDAIAKMGQAIAEAATAAGGLADPEDSEGGET